MRKNLRILAVALLGVLSLAGALVLSACGEEHEHVYTWEVVTEATCGAEGLRKGTCSCGETTSEPIPATGEHVAEDFSDDENHGTKCSVCGTTLTSEAHKVENFSDDENHGSRCTVCKKVLTSEPHDPVNWSDKENHGTKCSDCGKVLTSEAHTYVDGQILKESTCTEQGVQELECSCGAKTTKELPLAAHTPSGKREYNSLDHWTVCTVCGEEISRERHQLTREGACMDEACDFVMDYTPGLVIEEIEDADGNPTGESIVTGIGTLAKTPEIVIPSFDEKGHPVVAIGERVFSGNWNEYDGLTSVIIPDSIREIGDYAFGDNPNLKELDIPDSVVKIGMNALQNCGFESIKLPANLTVISGCLLQDNASLTSVTIPEHVEVIEKFVFMGCTSLAEINLPAGLVSVGNYSFDGCSALTKVNFAGTLGQWVSITFGESDANPLVANEKVRLYIGGKPITEAAVEDGTESIGDYVFAGYSALTSVSLPASLRTIGNGAFSGCGGLAKIVLSEGLESIGDQVFAGSGITSITIPASLGSIGSGVFKGCAALKTVVFTNGSKLAELPSGYSSSGFFSGCVKLESVTLAEGLEFIGNYAFYQCAELKSVSFPSTLKEIGNYAFRNCGKLTELDFNDGLVKIGSYAFGNETNLTRISFPSTLKEIGDYAFRECNLLTSVRLNDGLEALGVGAFFKCAELSDLYLPDTVYSLGAGFVQGTKVEYTDYNGLSYIGNWLLEVTDKSIATVDLKPGTVGIGDEAFYGCDNLAGPLVLPDTLLSIGENAFGGNANLTGKLTIPANVRYIAASAFAYCTGFDSLEFAAGCKLETIGENGYSVSGAFEGCAFTGAIAFPSSLTTIGGGAFLNCTGITEISFGENSMLKEIGGSYNGGAFEGCSSLAKATLPEGLEIIGNRAFKDCALTEIVIPGHVTEIGDSAFYGNASLTSVELYNSVTTIDWDAFHDCTSLETIRFHGTQEEWAAIDKKSGWNTNVPETCQIVCDEPAE